MTLKNVVSWKTSMPVVFRLFRTRTQLSVGKFLNKFYLLQKLDSHRWMEYFLEINIIYFGFFETKSDSHNVKCDSRNVKCKTKYSYFSSFWLFFDRIQYLTSQFLFWITLFLLCGTYMCLSPFYAILRVSTSFLIDTVTVSLEKKKRNLYFRKAFIE